MPWRCLQQNHYQAVIHCGIIRQTAAIEEINRECLRTGDNAVCKFRFMMRSEYLHEGGLFSKRRVCSAARREQA